MSNKCPGVHSKLKTKYRAENWLKDDIALARHGDLAVLADHQGLAEIGLRG